MNPLRFEDRRPVEIDAANLLHQHFARLDAAKIRQGKFEVQPGSDLADDDLATAYDPISYQVTFLFVSAFDHLRMFRQALEHDGMPIVAMYPLVRASLECAAQVLWLTTGGTRNKRVFRALHRVWNAAVISDEALRHLVPDHPSRLKELRARLDDLLAARRSNQRNLDGNYPSMTDIVKEAGTHVQSRTFTPIDVWRLCSSMAHANRSVAVAVLEMEPDGPAGAAGRDYIATTPYRVAEVFVRVAVDMIEAALDSLGQLNSRQAKRATRAAP